MHDIVHVASAMPGAPTGITLLVLNSQKYCILCHEVKSFPLTDGQSQMHILGKCCIPSSNLLFCGYEVIMV